MDTYQNRSDSMICNSISFNRFYAKKHNDELFVKQMDIPQNANVMDRCIEDKMRLGNSRECEISDRIIKRGGNNDPKCEPTHFCKGFQCYNNYHLSEYLITPCPINTWKNSIVENKIGGCSRRHQFYMNVTKRGNSVH